MKIYQFFGLSRLVIVVLCAMTHTAFAGYHLGYHDHYSIKLPEGWEMELFDFSFSKVKRNIFDEDIWVVENRLGFASRSRDFSNAFFYACLPERCIPTFPRKGDLRDLWGTAFLEFKEAVSKFKNIQFFEEFVVEDWPVLIIKGECVDDRQRRGVWRLKFWKDDFEMRSHHGKHMETNSHVLISVTFGNEKTERFFRRSEKFLFSRKN